MCGFPLMHLDKYLKVLVQTNKRFVAMCEEFRLPSSNPLEKAFERRVTRVLTPGTLIDESFLNHYQNNYLLAVGRVSDEESSKLGIAWMDVSTGEFFAQNSSMETLRDDVARIGPQEVVIDRALQSSPDDPLRKLLTEEECFISYVALEQRAVDASAESTDLAPMSDTTDDITAVADDPTASSVDDSDSDSTPFVFSPHETAAIHLLTSFLHENLMEHMPGALVPAQQASSTRMQIDAHTIKALEIREGMREGGATGSLLSVVKRTTTSSGTRLLARWLCAPSSSLAEINARQGLVALFLRLEHLRKDIFEMLRRIEDASRIVQRFLLGRGDAEDLAAIRDTIRLWAQIKSRIELERVLDSQTHGTADWAGLDMLMGKMKDLSALVQRIDLAIYDRPGKTTLGAPAEDDPDNERDEEADPDTSSPSVIAGTFKPSIKPE